MRAGMRPSAVSVWAFHFVFTSISAVYQFLVIGLRLFLPLRPRLSCRKQL